MMHKLPNCTNAMVEYPRLPAYHYYASLPKKNQSNLFKAAQKLVKSQSDSDKNQTHEHLHGRTTTRITTIYAIAPQLLPLWAGAKHIIAIERTGSRW